jgi:hypothetical protein
MTRSVEMRMRTWIGVAIGSVVGAGCLICWVSRSTFDVAPWAFVIALLLGVGIGVAFSHRERDIALPMPLAAVVAGFVGAFLIPLVLGFLWLMMALLIGGSGD